MTIADPAHHRRPPGHPLRALISGLALGAIGLVGTIPAPAPAASLAPEPAPVPKRWQLDVDLSPLRTAVIDVGEGPRIYAYVTYRVTNHSGIDLLFAPSFDLAMSDGRVLRSGRDVSVNVTNALLDRLENPFLQDQISILGTLLQGQENARDGLVIWPLPELNGDELIVYAAGFSGETTTVTAPDAASGKETRYVLRKTLLVRHRVPGEIDPAATGPLDVSERRWIMR